jgi:EAL domain-containing protein (putative c-di-GMP-specific phosphodiesterase class I)
MGHKHKHDQTALNDLTKLHILLPHWIEHNAEHAESLREWAGRARELGLEAVAEQIEVAVERMTACNEALSAALEELER